MLDPNDQPRAVMTKGQNGNWRGQFGRSPGHRGMRLDHVVGRPKC
jgi:hypothetical protein